MIWKFFEKISSACPNWTFWTDGLHYAKFTSTLKSRFRLSNTWISILVSPISIRYNSWHGSFFIVEYSIAKVFGPRIYSTYTISVFLRIFSTLFTLQFTDCLFHYHLNLKDLIAHDVSVYFELLYIICIGIACSTST